jgi:hypothetical protein
MVLATNDNDKGLLVKDFMGRYYYITIFGQKFFLLPEIAKELYNDFDQVTNYFEEEI